MTQLVLQFGQRPLVTFGQRPLVTPGLAKEAIQKHLGPLAELKSDPVWDATDDEWRAMVAITPWGPLVIMGFRLAEARVW